MGGGCCGVGGWVVDTGGSTVGGGCGGGGDGGFEGVQQAGTQILLEEKLYLRRGLVECGGVEVMVGVEVSVEGAEGARAGVKRGPRNRAGRVV